MEVPAALKIMLAELLNYNVLLTPQPFTLDEAVQDYHGLRSGPLAWMISRFVCPGSWVDDLHPYNGVLFNREMPLRVVVTGEENEDLARYLSGIRKDMAIIGELVDSYGDAEVVETYAPRLPAPIVEYEGTASLRNLLKAVMELIHSAADPSMETVFEIPISDIWRDTIPRVVLAIAAYNEAWLARSQDPGSRRVGVAFRFRSSSHDEPLNAEQIAFIIAICRDAGVRFMFLDGFDKLFTGESFNRNENRFGIVNLAAAASFAAMKNSDETETGKILEDSDKAHFRFLSNDFSYLSTHLDLEEIGKSREKLLLSCGGCFSSNFLIELKEWLESL